MQKLLLCCVVRLCCVYCKLFYKACHNNVSQKCTAWVNLFFTYCSFSIFTGVHSNYRIRFIVCLSFNLSIHSCNKCGKSQKKTPCRSVNMYFSRYLRGVILGFFVVFLCKIQLFGSYPIFDLFFCGIPRSQHPLLVAHCFLLFFTLLLLNLSHILNYLMFLPMTIEPFVGLLCIISFLILLTQGSCMFGVSTKPLKLSTLLVNQKATQCKECAA
jgi:hypothetical protein